MGEERYDEDLTTARAHRAPRVVDVTRRYAGVVLVDAADQVLLARVRWRRAWEHPGGRVRSGETTLTAAWRELREEARLDVPRGRFEYVCDDRALGVPFTTYVARTPTVAPRAGYSRLELSALTWRPYPEGHALIRPELCSRLELAYVRATAMLDRWNP